jgi:hypothetical protein
MTSNFGSPALRGPRLRGGVVLGVMVLLLLLPAATTGPGAGGTANNPMATSRTHGSSVGCSEGPEVKLNVSPGFANVSPLEAQVFTATALDACGSPLGGLATYEWWLSTPALGLLNASGGSSVAYTACLAPMDGVLRVRATVGETTAFANATIAVTLQNPGWEVSPSNPSAGGSSNAASGGSPGVRVAWGVGVAVLATIGLVFFAYARRRRSKERHDR